MHVDSVLDYNEDPEYMADLLLYNLTLEAEQRIRDSRLSKREIARRLGTSPAQLHRLLDPTNYRKSLQRLVLLLLILDCDVRWSVKKRPEARAARRLAG